MYQKEISCWLVYSIQNKANWRIIISPLFKGGTIMQASLREGSQLATVGDQLNIKLCGEL